MAPCHLYVGVDERRIGRVESNSSAFRFHALYLLRVIQSAKSSKVVLDAIEESDEEDEDEDEGPHGRGPTRSSTFRVF